MIQAQLDNEKAVLKKLEQNYADALEEVNSKIAELMGRADADMPHVIYQVDYQRALKAQIQGILKNLQSNEFSTVSEYLTKCYEEGFLGAMYEMQQQGVPLVIPMNQEEIAAAIQHETNLSSGLYKAFDTTELQKKIASEISRGFSTGAMYSEIARNVSAYAGISKNNAKRIVRTEGHRITETAAYHAQQKAKDRGADVVRVWSSVLDARTRPSHVKVDGEIRDIGKRFSNGLLFPGDPSGKAAEVINCRCLSRTEAKWALDSMQTKMLGDTSEMTPEQRERIAKKLGIPEEDLDLYSGQIVPINAKNYKDFKKQYNQLWHYEGSDVQKRAEERIAGYEKAKKSQKANKMAVASDATNDWAKATPRTVSKEEKQRITEYGKEKGINVVGLKNFDGDPELLKAGIDAVSKVDSQFALNKKITVGISQSLPDEDFASTVGANITLNAKALRSRTVTEANIAKGQIFASSTVEDMCFHEYGHIFATAKGNKGLEIAQKAYYNVFGKEVDVDEVLKYLHSNVSPYSISFNAEAGKSQMFHQKRYKEIIPEVLAKNNSAPDGFTEEFVELLKEL